MSVQTRIYQTLLSSFLVFIFGVTGACNGRSSATKDEGKQTGGDTPTKASPLANIIVVEDAATVERKPVAPLRSTEELPEVCAKTGGSWHHNLQSCRCEANKLFAPLWGCASIEVSPKGMTCLKEGMENALNKEGDAFKDCLAGMFPQNAYLSFDIEDWAKAPREKQVALAQTLDSSGFEFMASENDVKFSSYSHHYLPNAKDISTLVIATKFKSDGRLLEYYPITPLFSYEKRWFPFPVQEYSSADFRETCTNLLRGKNIGERSKSETYCAEVSAQLQVIREAEDLPFAPFYDMKNCTLCAKSYVHNVPTGGFPNGFNYTTVFRNFYTAERTVVTELDGVWMELALNARGNLMNVQFGHRRFLEEDSPTYLRTWNEIVTNDKLQVLSEESGEQTRLADLWNFLSQKKSQLVQEASALSNLRIFMFDLRLNLGGQDDIVNKVFVNPSSLENLPQRFEEREFRQFLKAFPVFEERLADWSKGNTPSPLQQGIFYEKGRHTNHADRMAETILHGLDKASLFPGGDYNRVSPADMVRFLKENKIDIVNCALVDMHRVSNYFSSIIAAAPEIVFIFGAGNYNVDHISEPGWSVLEEGFPNAIVAAEYYPHDSERKVYGNGGLGASLAVDLTDSKEGLPLPHKVGTSYAASRLSNFIGKLKLKYPERSASELVSMIHDKIIHVPDLSARNPGYVNFDLSHY